MGAIEAAAARAQSEGYCKANTFKSRVWMLRGTEHEPDWSLYRPVRYLHRSPGAPEIITQDHVRDALPEGEPIRIAVVGDAHDSPHLRDKSRFRWLGAFIQEHGFDRVVQIGDWWTMDCFSTHTDRATFQGRALPTFDQDRDSFHESQRAFQDGLGGFKPKKDVTLGNHEWRAWKWDNLHPEAEAHGLKVEEAFHQWGWRTTPYGQYRFIGGVGFVHIPLNTMGKPMGGKTGAQRSANEAVFDIIHGDTHKVSVAVAGRLGPVKPVKVFSIGAAFPPGYIEQYASHSMNDWESGIFTCTVWGGRVMEHSFTSMELLERRYGERWAA